MLVKFNPNTSIATKLRVIKTIKEELAIGLKEARDAVDYGEFECTNESFEKIKDELKDAGLEIIETIQ